MSDQTSDSSFAKVRRRDRAVEDEAWICAFLRRAPYGTLATTADGQPFINPMHFAFDEKQRAIYVHTGHAGQVNANIEMNERVCFCASKMGRLLPSDRAGQFSCEYASVVAYGTACVVTDEEEAGRALQMILDKYFPAFQPVRDYTPTTKQDTDATCVFRIRIDKWSGKKNQKPDDFPGAFHYPETQSLDCEE